MSRYGRGCDECQRCATCREIAYCLSEPGTQPCDHDLTLCGECNIAECPDCRREAELEMYRSGEYDPRDDPFVNPNAAEADAAYWASLPPEVPGSPGIFRHPIEDSA